MANPNPDLIVALRRTALRLQDGAPFAWSLMGSCNCGHLAQTITGLKATDIQNRALEQVGDWSDQIQDYCPASGLPMEDVFQAMMRIGMTRTDIVHLERLSDPEVLARLPAEAHQLRYTQRADAIRYLHAFADHLESLWMAQTNLPKALWHTDPALSEG